MTTPALNVDLQPRDLEIQRRLVYCYRITTVEYEARHHGIGLSTARKRLNRLTEARFLCRLSAWVSEVPPITRPLCQWKPGDAEPDFGAIAWAAQSRWRDRPQRRKTIYLASRKTLALYGLPPRPHFKLDHATHDLGVVEAYFYCRRRFPQYDFLGEEMFAPLRGHGEGVEDAQLIHGDRVVACVEYAGSYRRDRVEHFHRHVSERGIPYLLF